VTGGDGWLLVRRYVVHVGNGCIMISMSVAFVYLFVCEVRGAGAEAVWCWRGSVGYLLSGRDGDGGLEGLIRGRFGMRFMTLRQCQVTMMMIQVLFSYLATPLLAKLFSVPFPHIKGSNPSLLKNHTSD